MNQLYSRDTLWAFIILLFTSFVVAFGLVALSNCGICKFATDLTTLDGIIFSLPLMTIYIVVLIAALAGYARGKYMVDQLPLSQRLHHELKKCSMESANFKAKIRSGAQITEDNTFLDALQNLISSRISILAVVDNEGKVQGVITPFDLLTKLQEMRMDNVSLKDLAELKISELHPSKPLTAQSDENLQSVISKMVKNQYTKLVVVEENGQFSGTVDAVDMITEIYDTDCTKS